jgi:predicted Fe-Mo cluster-binding NifX family protein
MQVALTVWEDRISPLYDATRTLLITKVKGRRIVAKHMEPFECQSALTRAARLDELGINVLICGGISDFSENLIEGRGIQVIAFVSGTVDAVLAAYQTGRLNKKKRQRPIYET